MTEHRTSVVIRSYNEEQHIGRLLIGLLQQTRRPDEIVLVDSGSTDATLAIASRFPVEIRRPSRSATRSTSGAARQPVISLRS
jgi:glycosyltransferase involved in cell wall biosynthesis